MAEYKVIQDIEAEDKLLGPLTLRQFIYAAIVVAHLFVMWMLSQSAPLLIALFVPTAIFFGALAAPLGGAQSSEVWLLAKIRFLIKPRRRIWSQDGLQELVTITAPKKIEKQLTDNLSRGEVKSRLTALANTLDSRGWAIKHAYAPPAFGAAAANDDRLLDTSDAFDAGPTDQTVDVMDDSTSDVARQFDNLIQQSTQAHRAAVIDKVQHPDQQNQPADYWFMSSGTGGQPTNYQQKTVVPGSDDSVVEAADDNGQEEQQFLDKRHKEEARPDPGYSHLKTLQPLDKQPKKAHTDTSNQSKDQDSRAQAHQKNPDIMRLASNDDLNVSTIAREANRAQQGDDGEVVISLH